MDDRTLLELAAKAAGLEYHWVKVDGGFLMQASEPGSRSEESWNPITDDGDALRLAIDLNLTLLPIGGGESTGKAIGCRYEFTRRAITRAAAEIGRAMP